MHKHPQLVTKLAPKIKMSATRCSQEFAINVLEGDTKLHKDQEGLCWMEYTSPGDTRGYLLISMLILILPFTCIVYNVVCHSLLNY